MRDRLFRLGLIKDESSTCPLYARLHNRANTILCIALESIGFGLDWQDCGNKMFVGAGDMASNFELWIHDNSGGT